MYSQIPRLNAVAQRLKETGQQALVFAAGKHALSKVCDPTYFFTCEL